MINIAIKRTGPLDWTLSYLLRSLYTVNPILSPPPPPPPPPRGGLFIIYSKPPWGGGGGGGGLLETVSLFERGVY